MFVDVSSVSSGFFPVFLRWPSAFLLRYASRVVLPEWMSPGWPPRGRKPRPDSGRTDNRWPVQKTKPATKQGYHSHQKGWLQIGASVPQQLRCSERSFTDSIYPWTFPLLTSSRQKRTRCCHLGFPKKQSTKKPKEHETWKTQKKET